LSPSLATQASAGTQDKSLGNLTDDEQKLPLIEPFSLYQRLGYFVDSPVSLLHQSLRRCPDIIELDPTRAQRRVGGLNQFGAMTGVGHEDTFPRPRLSARCRFD